MANKKKKSSKSKKHSQPYGHYCRVCGERKDSNKFSGSGYRVHICKSCASKSPTQKSEDMTITKLENMALRYISETEKKWLKNRRNDGRPEVRELAQQVFEFKFPRLARNEIKQKLHIQNLLFRVHGEIYDGYGDEQNINFEFYADTSGKIIRKSYDENNVLIDEQIVDIGSSKMRKLFNVTVHNHEAPFWETDLGLTRKHVSDSDIPLEYMDDDYDEELFEDYEDEQETAEVDESDDREPVWKIEIKYKNGTDQTIQDYDGIPDQVEELFYEFNDYFEDELFDDDFDDKDGEDIEINEFDEE